VHKTEQQTPQIVKKNFPAQQRYRSVHFMDNYYQGVYTLSYEVSKQFKISTTSINPSFRYFLN